MTRHPLWVTALRLLLGALLLTTAGGKLLDLAGFAKVVGTYRILPDWLLLPAGLGLALAELALAIALVAGFRLAEMALAAAALHVVFLLWSALALTRGLEIANCGCFGVFWARPLTKWTLLEDLLLAAACLGLWRGARRTA